MDDVFAQYQAALRAGHQLAAEGKFKDALARYNQAATLAERPLPLIGVGGMQMRMGHAKEALTAYERALVLDPENLDALSGRAAALLATGRRAEAAGVQQQMASLREAPRVPADVPAELRTPWSRAETLAIAAEEARDSGNRDAAVDGWLAEAREHAVDQKFDAALSAALRALSVDTGSTRVHLELTRLYFERGWREQAIQHSESLRRLLELAPDESISAALDELGGVFAPDAHDG